MNQGMGTLPACQIKMEVISDEKDAQNNKTSVIVKKRNKKESICGVMFNVEKQEKEADCSHPICEDNISVNFEEAALYKVSKDIHVPVDRESEDPTFHKPSTSGDKIYMPDNGSKACKAEPGIIVKNMFSVSSLSTEKLEENNITLDNPVLKTDLKSEKYCGESIKQPPTTDEADLCVIPDSMEGNKQPEPGLVDTSLDTAALRGNYKTYSVSQKKRALDLADQNGIRPTARLLKIPHSTLRTWKRKFGTEDPKATKKPGQPAHFPETEEELHAWILTQRDLHLPVSREKIAAQARLLVNRPDFVASSGWLGRFFQRYKLSLRSKTSAASHLPEDLQVRTRIFLRQVEEVCSKYEFDRECIVNMDETTLSFDMVPSETVNVKGAQDVVIRSTGAGKRNLTVVLAISASGAALDPLVIFKGKRFPSDIKKVPDGLHVEMHPKGWMTASIMETWMTKVLRPYTQCRPSLLAMDSFAGHTTEKVAHDMERINAIPAFIPAGCTSKIQPLDVSINKPFKARVRRFWTAFVHNATKSGRKVKTASRQEILEWISDSWKLIKGRPEMIRASFEVTGLLGASAKAQTETARDIEVLQEAFADDPFDTDDELET